VDLRDIEYFAVVAEHGNLGRAADALGLSHPALSKSLRRLESSVQAKLVRRTPSGVELTAEGAALFSHARAHRMSLDDLTREIHDISSGLGGHLRIGIATGIEEIIGAPTCAVFHKEAPRVTVTMTSATNDVLVPALLNAEYDLIVSGIPAKPPAGLVQEPLYDDRFVVIASTAHPFARRRGITIEDLARAQWVLPSANTLSRHWLEQTFEQHRLPPPEVAIEANSATARLHIVICSDLLGFGSRQVVEQAAHRTSVAALSVRGMAWSRRVGVSYRKNAYLSPAAKRLIDVVKRSAVGLTPA
jgi:DNA-binding transcriptional LysR family regulator